MVLEVKNLPANAGGAGDMGSIPGSRRSPGGVHGNPLQCSCLGKFMDEEPGAHSPWGCRVRHDWSSLAGLHGRSVAVMVLSPCSSIQDGSAESG